MNVLRGFGVLNIIFGLIGLFCLGPAVISMAVSEKEMPAAMEENPDFAADPEAQAFLGDEYSSIDVVVGFGGGLAMIFSALFIIIGVGLLLRSPLGRKGAVWGCGVYIAIKIIYTVIAMYFLMDIVPDSQKGAVLIGDIVKTIVWLIYPIIQMIRMADESAKIATGELSDQSFEFNQFDEQYRHLR